MTGILSQLRKGGHLCNLQGKQFVLFAGLLELAHENGLKTLSTELIELDMPGRTAVFKATATGERGTFTAHGDATPQNVKGMVAASFMRMAETRATARALRFYLGIGMTARDELPGGSERPQQPAQPVQSTQVLEPAHHPSWNDSERKWFCAQLGESGVSYEDAAAQAESLGQGRPSSWDNQRRRRFVKYIEAGGLEQGAAK